MYLKNHYLCKCNQGHNHGYRVHKDIEDIDLIPKSYIESILSKDINEINGRQRDRNKMLMIMRSLARNETTLVGSKTIVKDIQDYLDYCLF